MNNVANYINLNGVKAYVPGAISRRLNWSTDIAPSNRNKSSAAGNVISIL